MPATAQHTEDDGDDRPAAPGQHAAAAGQEKQGPRLELRPLRVAEHAEGFAQIDFRSQFGDRRLPVAGSRPGPPAARARPRGCPDRHGVWASHRYWKSEPRPNTSRSRRMGGPGRHSGRPAGPWPIHGRAGGRARGKYRAAAPRRARSSPDDAPVPDQGDDERRRPARRSQTMNNGSDGRERKAGRRSGGTRRSEPGRPAARGLPGGRRRRRGRARRHSYSAVGADRRR